MKTVPGGTCGKCAVCGRGEAPKMDALKEEGRKLTAKKKSAFMESIRKRAGYAGDRYHQAKLITCGLHRAGQKAGKGALRFTYIENDTWTDGGRQYHTDSYRVYYDTYILYC